MNYIAKTRVGIAKDGKTLVDATSLESVSLFAAKGATIPEAKVKGKDGVSKYFKREGDAPEEPAAHKRVEPEPTASHSKAPTIKQK